MKATAYPIASPAKMLILFKNPREIAAINAMELNVIIPIIGPATKLFFAAPAKFKPITITIVPVTTGGRSQLIQPIPAARTINPTSARSTPAITTPPRAAAIPPLVFAAAMGAKNAKDEPR